MARALLSDERGTAMVEFAIVMPLLIVMGFGAAEFGRAIQHHHVVEKSARDAARYLSRVPADCATGIAAADILTAKRLAMTGYATAGTAPILSYWGDPATDSTVTVTVGCYDNSAGTFYGPVSMPLITVAIALPYQAIGFLNLVGVSPFSLSASHSQVSIGE
jgi:Flp pilus assembly protein TadG